MKIFRNDLSSISAKIFLNERQNSCLRECLYHLKNAAELHDEILIVEQLKYSLKSLRKIRGEYYNIEEIYDRVFANFCIGK